MKINVEMEDEINTVIERGIKAGFTIKQVEFIIEGIEAVLRVVDDEFVRECKCEDEE